MKDNTTSYMSISIELPQKNCITLRISLHLTHIKYGLISPIFQMQSETLLF